MSVASASSVARRVALVTGGNKGIGFEIVRQLAAADPALTVLLAARDQARGAAAVKTLSSPPHSLSNIHFLPLDVTSASSISAAATTVQKEYGQLNLLVPNAGVYLLGGRDNSTKGEDVDGTFSVNYHGVRDVSAAFLPLIPAGGRIVAVSSELAASPQGLGSMSAAVKQRFGSAKSVVDVDTLMDEYRSAAVADERKAKGFSSSHYGTSKVGVCAWARVLGAQLAPKQITVHSACPGWCKTDMSPGPRSAQDGASMIVHVCNLSAEDKSTGEFWSNREITKLFD